MTLDYQKSPPPETRQSKAADQSLQQKCLAAAEKDGEVEIAIRVFPDQAYCYSYEEAEILYAQSKLQLLGYSVETKTMMDSKCSRLVLTVEKNTTCVKQVKAERLKKQE